MPLVAFRDSAAGVVLRWLLDLHTDAPRLAPLSLWRGGRKGSAERVALGVSALRCVGCKRVIRIAGIHKIRTRGAQHFFDLLDRLPNHAARLAGLNLAF